MNAVYIEDDQFDYTILFWKERKHKKTGKVLDGRWSVSSEGYSSLAEAQAELELERKQFPDRKFRLTRSYSEVIESDYVDHGGATLHPALLEKLKTS